MEQTKTGQRFDTVYYWIGGTERGEWRECPGGTTSVDDTLRDIERMGYVAVRGKRSIGAPEGAPVAQLAARDAQIAIDKARGIGQNIDVKA